MARGRGESSIRVVSLAAGVTAVVVGLAVVERRVPAVGVPSLESKGPSYTPCVLPPLRRGAVGPGERELAGALARLCVAGYPDAALERLEAFEPESGSASELRVGLLHAIVLRAAGRHAAAVAAHRRVAALATAHPDDGLAADVLLTLAVETLVVTGDVQIARVLRARAGARSTEDGSSLAGRRRRIDASLDMAAHDFASVIDRFGPLLSQAAGAAIPGRGTVGDLAVLAAAGDETGDRRVARRAAELCLQHASVHMIDAPRDVGVCETVLAAAARSDGDTGAMERGLDRALALANSGQVDRSTSALLHDRVARVLESAGRLRAAVAMYDAAISASMVAGTHTPSSAGTLAHLAMVRAQMGELGRAEALLRESLAVTEVVAPASIDHALTLADLGRVLHDRGRLPAAAVVFDRALSIDPASDVPAVARIRLARALAAAEMGDAAACAWLAVHARGVEGISARDEILLRERRAECDGDDKHPR